MNAVAWDVREGLRARQRAVLDDLLAGRTPSGFDPVGSALATRVLLNKRAAAALHVTPELADWPRWRPAFWAWAAEHPSEGCAHDDVRRFVAWLDTDAPEPTVAAGRSWRRLHEVHESRRRFATARLGDRVVVAVGVGSSVWSRSFGLGALGRRGGTS